MPDEPGVTDDGLAVLRARRAFDAFFAEQHEGDEDNVLAAAAGEATVLVPSDSTPIGRALLEERADMLAWAHRRRVRRERFKRALAWAIMAALVLLLFVVQPIGVRCWGWDPTIDDCGHADPYDGC